MFDQIQLEEKFARMGARLALADGEGRRTVMNGPVALDVRRDRQGEFFEIRRRPEAEADVRVEVLDVQPADRHLLLMVRQRDGKHKFLCGHDERHWFVAAVPEDAPVGTVRAAKEALKPAAVHAAQSRAGLKSAARERRKNAAYRRQGEWFFLPAPALKVHRAFVLRNEPITRGNGGKPHWCDWCYRMGGETVYVCARFPGGVTEVVHRRLLADEPTAKGWNWRTMQRNAEVYVRGRVRHADHETIVLHDWHRVVMNTEHRARAMRHVAFLD
jgi:hypothetical protein